VWILVPWCLGALVQCTTHSTRREGGQGAAKHKKERGKASCLGRGFSDFIVAAEHNLAPTRQRIKLCCRAPMRG